MSNLIWNMKKNHNSAQYEYGKTYVFRSISMQPLDIYASG